MTGKDNRKPAVLLIAALKGAGQSNTNVIGGNKVLADEQIRELGARGFKLEAVDTSGGVTNLPGWRIRVNRMVRFLRVVLGVAKKLRRSQVAFLVITPRSALSLGTFLWIVCTMAHRPLVLRISGSGFGETYQGYGTLARWVADRTYMRSALVYLETQQSCRKFDGRANFRWFPNTRDIEAPRVEPCEQVKKLIFLAQLHMDKGLNEALEACRDLPSDCHLSVFGPRMSDTDLSGFDGHPRASYEGVVRAADVPRVLSEHDLLLFPSYCRREGYPGSILEAFQCGLPVVAARWGGVPELVEHEESGLIVEPRSATAVRSAIKRLLEAPDLYRRLCKGAKQRGDYFRSVRWYDRMVSELHGLCRD